MATSVSTSAAFTTANMKPDSGEQIDSLWGKNIADNTGFLYYRKRHGPTMHFFQPKSSNGDRVSGTYFFEKLPGLNTFTGSFVGFVGDEGAGVGINFKINGVTFHSATHDGTSLKQGTAVDISGLTDGVTYELTYDVNPSSISTGSTMLNVTTWFSV